jgi:hypothetical protein
MTVSVLGLKRVLCEKETEKGLQKFLKVKKMSNQEYLENEPRFKKRELDYLCG